jgi:hypothetical protein
MNRSSKVQWDGGRWPQERVAVLKASNDNVYYKHTDCLLATLWRGTSHVIPPVYPLLHWSLHIFQI